MQQRCPVIGCDTSLCCNAVCSGSYIYRYIAWLLIEVYTQAFEWLNFDREQAAQRTPHPPHRTSHRIAMTAAVLCQIFCTTAGKNCRLQASFSSAPPPHPLLRDLPLIPCVMPMLHIGLPQKRKNWFLLPGNSGSQQQRTLVIEHHSLRVYPCHCSNCTTLVAPMCPLLRGMH